MKNYKLDVVRYNNEDVIATSGNVSDVDFTVYPYILFFDQSDAAKLESITTYGKVREYTYNPTTGCFDHTGTDQDIGTPGAFTESYYVHQDSSGNGVLCEHPETHIFNN